MTQVVQLIGAVLILIAFTAGQAGRMSAHSLAYILLNLVGSTALAATAGVTANWGFLLLETVWAIVSAWSLVKHLRTQAPADTREPTS